MGVRMTMESSGVTAAVEANRVCPARLIVAHAAVLIVARLARSGPEFRCRLRLSRACLEGLT
jgi:hypothetical protein